MNHKNIILHCSILYHQVSPVLEMNFLGIKSQLKDVVAKCKERCQREGADKDGDESVLQLE